MQLRDLLQKRNIAFSLMLMPIRVSAISASDLQLFLESVTPGADVILVCTEVQNHSQPLSAFMMATRSQADIFRVSSIMRSPVMILTALS